MKNVMVRVSIKGYLIILQYVLHNKNIKQRVPMYSSILKIFVIFVSTHHMLVHRRAWLLAEAPPQMEDRRDHGLTQLYLVAETIKTLAIKIQDLMRRPQNLKKKKDLPLKLEQLNIFSHKCINFKQPSNILDLA